MSVDKHMRILIIDDFPPMRKMLGAQLAKLGFLNQVEAENGMEALAVLKERDVRLIFSDWHMPEMDGLELLKAIRGLPKLQKIPFIMLTAEGKKESVIAAAEAGVNGYLIKPFDPDALKTVMTRVIGAFT